MLQSVAIGFVIGVTFISTVEVQGRLWGAFGSSSLLGNNRSIYTSVNSMLWDSVCCMLVVEEACTQQRRYRQTEEYKIVSVAYV